MGRQVANYSFYPPAPSPDSSDPTPAAAGAAATCRAGHGRRRFGPPACPAPSRTTRPRLPQCGKTSCARAHMFVSGVSFVLAVMLFAFTTHELVYLSKQMPKRAAANCRAAPARLRFGPPACPTPSRTTRPHRPLCGNTSCA
jgi:hypothetical protein